MLKFAIVKKLDQNLEWAGFWFMKDTKSEFI